MAFTVTIYFFRFVNLLRAKTPKVTFYSEKAKCLLMENDPDPDFEVCFYEGKQLYSEVYFLCKQTLCSLYEMLKRNECQSTICLHGFIYNSVFRFTCCVYFIVVYIGSIGPLFYLTLGPNFYETLILQSSGLLDHAGW